MDKRDALIEKLKEYIEYLIKAVELSGVMKNITLGVREKYRIDIDILESELANEKQITPNEIKVSPDKTAEEILKEITGKSSQYLKQNFITFNQCLEAMQEYHEAKLREELIKYDRAYWGLRGDSEKQVDDYLKQRNNGQTRRRNIRSIFT